MYQLQRIGAGRPPVLRPLLLRALETGLAELWGRFDRLDDQLVFLRDIATEAGADE